MNYLKENINKCITNHKSMLIGHQFVVCLDCLSEYNKDKIKDWCDDNDTAICPYCWNDTVLLSPQQTNLYTNDDLVQFRKYYFDDQKATTHDYITFVDDETFSIHDC